MADLHLIKRDPDKGYFGRQLWIPKKHVNVRSIKAGLEYPVMGDEGIDYLQLWEENETHIIVPREFIPRDQYPILSFPIIQTSPTSFPAVKFKSHIKLDKQKPHQTIQRDAFKAMCTAQSGILNLSCGRGKTVIALHHIARKGVPALIIVNNTTLIDQWNNQINKFLEVEGGIGLVQGPPDNWDWEGRGIVLAMIHSLALRYEELPDGFDRYFGGVYFDECFVAGTTVDGLPIEKRHVGDIVRSYDETTDTITTGRVTKTSKTRPKLLVRLCVEDTTYYCTPSHPFKTAGGWVCAGELVAGDYIKGIYNAKHRDRMHSLPESSNPEQQAQEVLIQKNGESLLLQDMLPRAMQQDLVSNNAKDQYIQIRHPVRANEEAQPNVRSRTKETNSSETEENAPASSSAGRERNSNSCTTDVSLHSTEKQRARMVPGVCSSNEPTQAQQNGLCDALQTRYSKPRETCLRGGGWENPSSACTKEARQEKGAVLGWFRVDSVEILEPGSDQTFGGVCPDGFVHNLEIEGTHTYLVDDLIVHNCHHLSASVFIRTAPMFYGARDGLTATVSREDGLESIYQYHIGPVFFRHLTQDLKPRIYIQEMPTHINFQDPDVKKEVSDCRGMPSIPKLRGYLCTRPEANQFIANKLQVPLQKGRKVLALSHCVEQLTALNAMFPDSGLCIGDVAPHERIETLRHKQITFGTLQLVKEALDEETLDTIFFLTPFGSGAVEMGGKNSLQQGMGRILRPLEGKKHPVVVILDPIYIPKLHRMCGQLKRLINAWPRDEGGPFEYTILSPYEEKEPNEPRRQTTDYTG